MDNKNDRIIRAGPGECSAPPLQSEARLSAFDAVVMLTWSDWKTEPRSNRYHYATRFARHLPVYFVQPARNGDIVFEDVGSSIVLVHAGGRYGPAQADALTRALYQRGVRRPLLWVYNVMFEHYILRAHAGMIVYHATEAYFVGHDFTGGSEILEPLKRVLASSDLVVSVSEAVARSYDDNASIRANVVLENGCDAVFLLERLDRRQGERRPRTALFQGGINKRLDFPLLNALASRRTEWTFWFCGRVDPAAEGWESLLKLPNVRYFGELDAAAVADLSLQASVGLIPFIQNDLMRISLPLKAYEYVACDLPVVSIPIDALARRPDLFFLASASETMSEALDRAEAAGDDPSLRTKRRKAALDSSYERRFDDLLTIIAGRSVAYLAAPPALNLGILYDDRSTHVRTIVDHLDAFRQYSKHTITYMPATGLLDGVDNTGDVPNLNVFDAIIVHYSVRLTIPEHLSPAMRAALTGYCGPKLAFIQDEYEETETTRQALETLRIDGVFTCVPLDEVEKVYPHERFPHIRFFQTLTGYVPSGDDIEHFAMPLEDRDIWVGYRGRHLPHHYGELGHDKWRIGVEMKRLLNGRNIPSDIEVDERHRIYGRDWFRFLGRCRAMLGTESGSNVFDEGGQLKKLAQRHADLPYETFARTYLSGVEGSVRMNQISPKFFEAIRLRTALVLFRGDYSGVLVENIHYIPLNHDFSNLDEVLEKLADLLGLQRMIDRAYADIVASGKYAYESFVRGVETILTEFGPARRRAQIMSVPLIAFLGDRNPVPLWPTTALAGIASNRLLEPPITREFFHDAIHDILKGKPTAILLGEGADATYGKTTDWLIGKSRGVIARATRSAASGTVLGSMARSIWKLLPRRFRHYVGRKL